MDSYDIHFSLNRTENTLILIILIDPINKTAHLSILPSCAIVYVVTHGGYPDSFLGQIMRDLWWAE
jgi:hypothetical protein